VAQVPEYALKVLIFSFLWGVLPGFFVYRDMTRRGKRPWPWVVGIVVLLPVGIGYVVWLFASLRYPRVTRVGDPSLVSSP
jgi:hypothetical protein